MTAAQRNLYFKGAVLVSAACLAALGFLAGTLAPLYPGVQAEALHRAPGLLQALAARFAAVSAPVPLVSVIVSVVYALAASALVFYFFEKTLAPEILFFDLFALSFVFEAVRVMPPLGRMHPLPSVILVLGGRLLIFGRFFGVLSLFASSVYAAGLDIQKQGQIIAAMIIAVLVVALRVPVNSQSWDSTMTMLSAYAPMFRFAQDALIGITVLGFLVAAQVRGTGEYLYVALGAFLAFLGRDLLIGADTWVTLVPGALALAGGTWFITVRLHRVYLWL